MMTYFTPKVSRLLFSICAALLFISLTSSAQWVSRANGIITRSEVTSVVYNGKLYTFLGFRDSYLNVEASSEVYDPSTNTWSLLSSMPQDKVVTHQGVVLVDNTVWHIGGRVGKHPGPVTSETWIYNITTNTWSPGPQILNPATGMPLLWGGGGAAILGRTLHIFGGFVSNACNNDQSSYHLTLDVDSWLANPTKPAQWKNELAPLPIKRNHFSTVVLGGKIYVIGGQFGHDCGGGQDQPYCHVYNPATNTWTELPLLPTPRSHAEGSAFAIDGKIYLVAGQATNGANTNKVTIFDPAANSGKGAWMDDTNLTLPKSYEGLSSKVINSTFIISHGGEGSSHNTRKTTYSRTLSRTPVYKLEFLPACATIQLVAGQKRTTKTRLFTIDGTKGYSTSSNVSWLTVTKNATGTAIQNAVDIEVSINTTGLAPGTYKGIISAAGTGSGPAYTAAQYCVNLTVTPSTTTLEAEDAVLYRAVVASSHAGYTGRGFVDYINATSDYVEWTVNRQAAGSASLQFRYANGGSTSRSLKLDVNGVTVASSLAFPVTGSWSNWTSITMNTSLIAGNNKIRLTAIGSSGPNMDHLVVKDGVPTANTVSPLAEQNQATTNPDAGLRVTLAPNPANGVAKIIWSNVAVVPLDITITNELGVVFKTFYVQNSNTGQLSFSVLNLPDGIYIVFVKQGKTKASTKFLVKK